MKEVEEIVSLGIRSVLETSNTALPGLPNLTPVIAPAKSGHGDYQSNTALVLSKALKLKPLDLSVKIVSAVESMMKQQGGNNTTPIIGSLEVSGPGFINIHLSEAYIASRLDEMSRREPDGSCRLGVAAVASPDRVVVDFSSPNIAKEMHVGHLRSTIIGDCISRVLEFQGHDVLRLNHVGDWGTQFGMLIQHLRQERSQSAAVDQVSVTDLLSMYKVAKRRFDEDSGFREAARQEVVRLQRGDPDSLALWRAICATSRAAFQEIYDLLGVRLTERGESFYNPFLGALVRRLQEDGVAEESQGAQCVFLKDFKGTDNSDLPLIVQKSDGGYLYATTDLAAVAHRVEAERADRIIYVTDAGQAQHFAMVFAAARKAGLLERPPRTEAFNSSDGDGDGKGPVRLQHVPFGLVLGEDGKKIKSRAGDSVRLRDLLDEAVRLAEQGERQRQRDRQGTGEGTGEKTGKGTGDGERKDAEEALREKAKAIGLGAVKYADLCMHRESNYRFSFAKMLALSGNTAPYMLYAYVRIRGIQRRAAASQEADPSDPNPNPEPALPVLKLQEPAEKALARHLIRFEEVLQTVGNDLQPNKLCDYLYELSHRFNQFYEACPVLQAPTPALKRSRAQLCAITADTLKTTLQLLGIDTVEEM